MNQFVFVKNIANAKQNFLSVTTGTLRLMLLPGFVLKGDLLKQFVVSS